MVRPLPSKTERLVRAFLLLITSAVLTLVAWSLGLYRSGDSTQVAIAIFAIVIAAVLVSRFSAKRVMRLFGWGHEKFACGWNGRIGIGAGLGP